LLAGRTRPSRRLANNLALLFDGAEDRVLVHLRASLLAQARHRQPVLVQRDARPPLPAARYLNVAVPFRIKHPHAREVARVAANQHGPELVARSDQRA